MPRDTLRLLGEDTDRLLFAGAAAASADAGLRARHAALKTFAVKIPRLAPLAEQVGRVVGADVRDAAEELLNLASVVAQLRGSAAAVVVPPEAPEPLPEAVALDTPLSVQEVEALHRALTRRSGDGRVALITDALARDRVRDLRLFPAWIEALSDGRIGELVATEVLPRLGDAVRGPLRAAFSRAGGSVDARRLLCLARLEDGLVRPLAEECLAEGSTPVRAAALEVIAGLDAPLARARALSLVTADPAGEVRATAAWVLGRDDSDEALDALLRCIADDADVVGKAAVRALQRFQHADATRRVIELLTPEALAIKPYAPKRRRVRLTPAQQKAALHEEQAETARAQERCNFVVRVIEVLSARGDAEAMAWLRRLAADHPFKAIPEAARKGLCEARDPEGLELLASSLASADHDRRRGAIEAIFAMGPEAAYARFSPCFEPDFIARDKSGILGDIVERLIYDAGEAPDPRWADRMLALLSVRVAQPWAVDLLTTWKDPRAAEAFIALLDVPRSDFVTLLDALARLGDPRATAPVLSLLDRKKSDLAGLGPWWILNALERIDDPAGAPLLRAAAQRPKRDPELAKQLEAVAVKLERNRSFSQ